MTRRLRHDLSRLAAAERAAQIAGEAVASWWKELGDSQTISRSLDTVFKEALSTIAGVLEAEAVALLLADESERELVARAAVGLSEEVTLGMRIRRGEGMAGRVLAGNCAVLVDELSNIEVVSPVLRHSGLRSIVAVPLISGDRKFGVLYAGSYTPQNFDLEDCEFMDLLAGRLAGALDRIRLFDNERSARHELELAFEKLTTMQRVTSLLAAAMTADEVAEALEHVMAASARRDAPTCMLWLVRDDSLTAVRPPGTDASPLGPGRLAISASSPIAVCVRERRPIHANGDPTSASSRALRRSDRSTRAKCVVLPVLVGAKPIGALTVSATDGHRFTAEELELLSVVVAQTAQSLDRARLYEEQRGSAEVAAFFARAAKVTAEASDLAETLDRLAFLALEVAGDICLIDVVGPDGGIKRMVALHKQPVRQHLVDLLRTRYPPDPAGSHPAVAVIRTGEVLWGEFMSDEFLHSTTRDDEHFALTKRLGFRSYLAVPLASDGEILGSMTLVSTSRPVGRNEVAFAKALADQVAAVVDNARRYDATSRVSQILQASLLPQEMQKVAGLDVHTLYLPATRGLEIGGDFYDLVALPDGRAWFTVGDVAGHDSAAAAMMGHLRSAARTLMARVDSPAELVTALQCGWGVLGFKRMATAVFGLVDPADGKVVMASAGHYPPLLVGHGDSHFLELVSSPPLGVTNVEVPEWMGVVEPGELLLLYTDGAIDERNIGSEKSMKRLAEAASDGALDAADVCSRVIERLDVDRIDDIALMALRRVGERG